MGCSYETAKHTIRINKISTATTSTAHLNARTRNFNKKTEKQFLYNCSTLNQHSAENHNNDDCQFVRVQQQQKLATTNTTCTTKANKTTTITVSEIFKLNNNSNEINSNSGDNFSTKENIGINRFSLEEIKFIGSVNNNVAQETNNFDKVDSALQESCINSNPIACHNRVCCEQQYKQQPRLVVDKIKNHTKHTVKPSNYITSNNFKSYSNCSNNNYCRCHLSFFHHKHTKNTLRNEQQCEANSCRCNCVANQSSDFATFSNTHSKNSHRLQKTISYPSTSLTANVIDLKSNLMDLMVNCAAVAKSLTGVNASLLKNCLNNGIVSKINSTNKCNTNNKNHNKSEPYRGYCQRVNHLPNKTDYTSYTSSTISNTSNSSISISNSCSLHYATSSNSRCNNNNHDINNNSNTISCKSNNNRTKFKRFHKSYTNTHSCQTSSAHPAGFSYIGNTYYSFLRNTINLYTASSVILVLCYLTSTTSAATTKSDTTSIDKHPIRGIDWSKFDESSSDKEILDLLLEKKRYDKRLLPPVNDEDFCCGLSSPDMASEIHSRRPHKRGTLTVNVNVLLLSLASPDESSLKYEVEFLLNQQWNDPRLQYGNKSHYDFLNALHHHDSIWTPDTYFIMHGDFKDPIIPMHFALRIYRNGTITYAMRRHLILSCQGSLHIFPFDDPKCSFSMESISYEEAQIKYIWKNDEDTLRKSPSLTTLNAYLIKNQTTACDQNSWRGNYSCLQVELTFTRDRAYYFTTVFIPGVILVTSSFITFWLEWNAVPARVMIGVTTMLNFFTTSNGFRSTLPVVSNLTAMNVWDGVCMCFIYASLLEFVCVNYMGRKRPQHNVVYRPGENPVTQRLPAVLSRIGVILASPLPGEKKRDVGGPNEIVACTTCGGSSGSPCTHSVNNGCATETCFVQVRKKEPPHPIRIAKTIDVIARITFPTAYSIFLIFFFVHYKGFS